MGPFVTEEFLLLSHWVYCRGHSTAHLSQCSSRNHGVAWLISWIAEITGRSLRNPLWQGNDIQHPVVHWCMWWEKRRNRVQELPPQWEPPSNEERKQGCSSEERRPWLFRVHRPSGASPSSEEPGAVGKPSIFTFCMRTERSRKRDHCSPTPPGFHHSATLRRDVSKERNQR